MASIQIHGDREGMPKIKVTYFFARGMAELCRLLLVAGGVSYEDERVEYTEEFSKWKAEGSLPFGKLPVLTIDGRVFGQSYSCARYCAKLSGLMGSHPLMAFEIDSIIDATNDIRGKHVKIRYLYRHQTTYEANMCLFDTFKLGSVPIGKEETIAKYWSFFTVVLPPALADLSRHLGSNDFFCASKTLTAADIAVVSLFHQLQLPNCALQAGNPEVLAMGKDCIDAFPNLIALQKRVEAHSKIKLHLSRRTQVEHGMIKIALEAKEGVAFEVEKK